MLWMLVCSSPGRLVLEKWGACFSASCVTRCRGVISFPQATAMLLCRPRTLRHGTYLRTYGHMQCFAWVANGTVFFTPPLSQA